MRIQCPFCGERAVDEFTHRGAALLPPRPDAPVEDWAGHVYLRDNPAGPYEELWYHGGGCGAWLVVTRDTLTHRILATREARKEEEHA